MDSIQVPPIWRIALTEGPREAFNEFNFRRKLAILEDIYGGLIGLDELPPIKLKLESELNGDYGYESIYALAKSIMIDSVNYHQTALYLDHYIGIDFDLEFMVLCLSIAMQVYLNGHDTLELLEWIENEGIKVSAFALAARHGMIIFNYCDEILSAEEGK